MISINQLQVAYGSRVVLHDINLSMASGNIHGIVGLNGSGKSTLFNTMFGFVKPHSGHIMFNGAPLSKKNLAYLETSNFFYSNITGHEYLSIFPSNNKKVDINSWQDLLKLPLNDLTDTYSTGMKKKLALLALLKTDKEILLLDEPFNGLDMESVKILSVLVQQLKEKGKTILITSHILETLTSLCDTIHHLENGRFVKSYSRSDMQHLSSDLFGSMEENLKGTIGNIV